MLYLLVLTLAISNVKGDKLPRDGHASSHVRFGTENNLYRVAQKSKPLSRIIIKSY